MKTKPDPSAALLRRMTSTGNPDDASNPDLHVSGEIFSLFHRHLADRPLWWNTMEGGDGFWSVGGYDVAAFVLKRSDLFSADVRNGGNRIFDAQCVTDDPARMLLALDPPVHTDLRNVIAPFFTPEAVAAQVPVIRDRAARLIGKFAGAGQADFVSDFAEPYTMGLATSLLGLPEDLGPHLARWSSVLLGDDDPELQPSLDVRRAAIAEFDAFAIGLFDGTTPTKTDLLPALRKAAPGGIPLNFNDFSVNFLALVVAISDTTRHAVSGSIVALDAFPEFRRQLLLKPELIPFAAKEIIRWASPLFHVRRTALLDVTVAGTDIRQGQKLVVWFGGANRDPKKWSDPDNVIADRFCAKQTPATMAFSAGPHFCLGWRFAELEMTIMLEAVLALLPDIRCASPPVYMRSNFIRGIKHLSVQFGVSCATEAA
jgi:linalool 8-monooxygenase